VPESRRRKPKKSATKKSAVNKSLTNRSAIATRARIPQRGPSPRSDLPPIDPIVDGILAGAEELLDVANPLEAEMWASVMLGLSYKRPLPIDVQEELPKVVWGGVLDEAEHRADPATLAALHAVAAVADPDLAGEAARIAGELAERGIPEPPWADEIGRPEFVRAWTITEPYGDQVGYFAHFRYPGRPEHMVAATYDENLGGIIKDASAGELDLDPRATAEANPDVTVGAIDPAELAARLRAAIASGDSFIDNDWTEDFRDVRALLLSRVRLLPEIVLPEPDEPPDDDAREALIDEFLAAPDAPPDDDVTRSILDHCLMARCDFGDGDPFRWSPTVVELFMLDFVPRKGSLDMGAIRALPEVLKRWIAFSLGRRGLDRRWIVETQEAVDELAPRFLRAVTDPSSFGLAKSMASAMQADGVALDDPDAVQGWIDAFNARPFEEREAFLSRFDPEPPA
jgi:hypothetical protein